MTDSIEGRLSDHQNRRFNGFTKNHNCTQLVYYETFETAEAAAKPEKQIKGWTRTKKNALIATMNPDWDDLSRQGILRFAQD